MPATALGGSSGGGPGGGGRLVGCRAVDWGGELGVGTENQQIFNCVV